jgi:Predicted nucleotidyltransferases
MPVTDEDIETAKAIARQYGATRMVVFGSAVENPEHAHDLDLAIEGVEGWTIWSLAAEIEENLDIPVDVIPLDPSPFTELVEEYGREIRLQQDGEIESGRSASNWIRWAGSLRKLSLSTRISERTLLL